MTVKNPGSNPGLDIGDLLTIDVAAEVRKLSRAQLDSPAQLPVELVRRAFAAGASLADVRCDKRSVAVRDDGAPISPELLDALAALLNAQGAQQDRHQALLQLEATGDLALLALAGIDFAMLRVRSGGRVLHVKRGERPTIGAAAGGGTTVEIAGAPLDLGAVRDAVRLAVRFAIRKVLLDGVTVTTSPFGDVLFEDELKLPIDERAGGVSKAPPRAAGARREAEGRPGEIAGRLAFPATGDTARVWILLDGVTATHIALPGLPCFEAAVDARAFFPRGQALPPPSALREALEPHLAAITDRALERMERVAAHFGDVPRERHPRVREWVVTAIRKKLRVASMRTVRVFPVIESAQARFVSLDDLAALSRDASGLVALFPEQDPAKFVLPASPVPVLDAVERGRLSALLSLSFRPPAPRRAEAGALAGLRSSLADARRGLRDALRRVLHPFDGRPVSDASLSSEERTFLAMLREHVMTESCEDLDVRFVEGSGPVRQLSRPTPVLLLPRANPTVRTALTTLSRDRSWIYPVALALEAIPRPATRSLF